MDTVSLGDFCRELHGVDLTKRFEIGDYVRFIAKEEDSFKYPYGVNGSMERLCGDVFEVVDAYPDRGNNTQRVKIAVCQYTKDPAYAEHQMHWTFSASMFELAEEFAPNRNPLEMSFDDLLNGVDREVKQDEQVS
ncbi:MAG: hypothetical protein IKP74_04875 [Clostridia bacterium]|nr:hypothetical protein [Clostridia bacterium]